MGRAILDAIVIGAGPSGLGTSLALSGWRPHYVPNGLLPDAALRERLNSRVDETGAIPLDELPALASGLRGRSNNPLALFFDALQHPGVDSGMPVRSCLELRRSSGLALSHLLLDPAPPGGSWHGMHEATRTLSPGPWMEFPGYSLSQYLSGTELDGTAQQRQPRGLVAEYYSAAARHFGVAEHHRPWRVVSVERAPNDDGGGGGTWTVHVDDGTATPPDPLRARALVLGVGTYGLPRTLAVPGADLPFVVRRLAALPPDARSVLVVGAGLSASDCIVHCLRRGMSVTHAFRGGWEATKVGSKFASDGARAMYPEYHALVGAMRRGAREPSPARSSARSPASPPARSPAPPQPLLGGSYSALPFHELRRIGADGRCELELQRPPGEQGELGELGEQGELGGQACTAQTAHTTAALDAVALLVGSEPDLGFLPPDVREAIAAAGPPSQRSDDGVGATHPVFVGVDPYSMEVGAVRGCGLFALGPLRGDNFARFAIHDGHGVAEAIRSSRRARDEQRDEALVADDSHRVCEGDNLTAEAA